MYVFKLGAIGGTLRVETFMVHTVFVLLQDLSKPVKRRHVYLFLFLLCCIIVLLSRSKKVRKKNQVFYVRNLAVGYCQQPVRTNKEPASTVRAKINRT